MRPKSAGHAETVVSLQIFSAAGYRDDPRLRLRFPERRDQLETVAIGHDNVRDHEVERLFPEQPGGFPGTADRHNGMSPALQPMREEMTNSFFIISDQN
jgi:hypothetical protein